jgi:hypothetical protein
MSRATLSGWTQRQRPPVLIVGAHRSGTTATSRALRLLGLQLGEHLDSHEESRPLQRLHENYLHQLSATWHEPDAFLQSMRTDEGRQKCTEYLRENVRRNFAAIFGYRRNLTGLTLLARLKLGGAWGWKDPRTTLFGRSWLEIFPGAHILHVVRHPVAVASSIQRREIFFQAKGEPPTGQVHDLNHCVRLAVTYIEAGEALAACTSHFHRVKFEDIQENPVKLLAILADFCGLRFSAGQMVKAAASIRPDKTSAWRDLPAAAAEQLLSNYPVAAKLGYGWDAATR